MKDIALWKLIPTAAPVAAILVIAALAALPAVHTGAHQGAHAGAGGAIVVQSVHSDSPAAAAGLAEGDRLLRLAGQEIAAHDDLKRVMAAHRPGDTVPLAVEREGETVELELTFGERPGGGVSIGVSLAIMGAGPELAPGEGLTRAECLVWVDETYRLDAMMRDLGLELAGDARELRSCLERNLEGMRSPMPTGWCDNALKIHCSGLDLLTEIGEAGIERCGELLGAPLDSCAGQKVFDRYMQGGEPSDKAACRAARESCRGTE